jgi:hypothetical protein
VRQQWITTVFLTFAVLGVVGFSQGAGRTPAPRGADPYATIAAADAPVCELAPDRHDPAPLLLAVAPQALFHAILVPATLAIPSAPKVPPYLRHVVLLL